MDLVEVDVVSLQSSQTFVQRILDIDGVVSCIVGLQGAVLGSHDDILSVLPLQRDTKHTFTRVVVVRLGGVEEVHAELQALVHDVDGHLLTLSLPGDVLVAAVELPTAEANVRHLKVA